MRGRARLLGQVRPSRLLHHLQVCAIAHRQLLARLIVWGRLIIFDSSPFDIGIGPITSSLCRLLGSQT
jgi:hypothetical protein